MKDTLSYSNPIGTGKEWEKYESVFLILVRGQRYGFNRTSYIIIQKTFSKSKDIVVMLLKTLN